MHIIILVCVISLIVNLSPRAGRKRERDKWSLCQTKGDLLRKLVRFKCDKGNKQSQLRISRFNCSHGSEIFEIIFYKVIILG
jgi:hypothetical protein